MLLLRLTAWFPAVMFISGSDDGTVRHYDTREPASANSIPGMRTGDVLGKPDHPAKNQLGGLCTCLLLEAQQCCGKLRTVVTNTSLQGNCLDLYFTVELAYNLRICCS